MSKPFAYIALLAIALSSCRTQQEAVTQQSVSAKDYPYIETFHQGLRFKTQGRTDEAIAKFEKCLQMRQDDDAVYYALSKLELQRGNESQSAEYIVKAAEIDPDNTWYIQELAYMYYEREDFEKSVENFKKLVDIEPRNVDWLYGYAEALVQVGRQKEAIDALNKTEDQVGKHPQFALQKYNLYMSMKDPKSAEEELLKAKDEFPKDPQIIGTLVDHYFGANQEEKALEALKELGEADPGNGRVHLALADIYQRQGKMDKAYEELRIAYRSTELDIDTKMTLLIRVHEQSRTIDPEIYELVDIMVEMYPTEAKAHSIHGDYLLRAEKEDEALKAYQKALEFDKNQFPIWNQVLIMEYQAEDFETLYEHSTECLELFPTSTLVYLLNGISANQLRKYEKALETLSVGQELVLDDKAMKAEFLGQIGEANFGVGDDNKGIVNYRKAIELDPQSTLLKNNFARRLATSKRDLELAESLAKQVTAISPKQAIFKDTYGWVMFQKGEFQQAKELFEEALLLDDENVLIIEHLGDVSFKLGDKTDAVKWWQKAKELGATGEILDKKITEKKYYDPQR